MKKSRLKRLRILFDSGCGATIINHKLLKKLKQNSDTKTKWKTKAGSFNTSKTCKCTFFLPEFHANREIEWRVHVDESDEPSRYDMILGRDLMETLGIDLCFSQNLIKWDNASTQMRDPRVFDDSNIDDLEEEVHNIHDPLTTEAERIQRILDVKYAAADLEKFCIEQKHLSPDEQAKLWTSLNKHKALFDGTLGSWKMDPYNIELKDPDCKPYHARPYPVPHSQMEKLKAEINRLVELGILEKINRSEWAAPAFTIAKKEGDLRSIADFRELNQRIKRKPFPIPKIQDLLLQLEGFKYATTLDLNMGYYHIQLTPFASTLCTIVLPWGKYQYCKLPMGLCNSPDIFQEKMSELMAGIDFVRGYLDDLLCISTGTLEDHLEKLCEIFDRLETAGLKVNLSKSEFCKGELEYLGHWITREGVQPLSKKVESISNLAPPTTRKKLRTFLGMVNYYRDMWIRRSHVLAPLTALTSTKVKYKWTEVHQKAFDDMKRILARETLLAHPDFSQPFHVHADASKLQLGAVISQGGRPIAFYSRKLADAQTRYTTTERELLSIVESLKEFRNILFGHQIIIHTDHENLTFKVFNSERVMRWRLYIEEYSPDLRYIKGSKNVVADALSRLDINWENMEEAHFTEELRSHLYCYAADEMAPTDYPLSYKTIGSHQQKDKNLIKKFKKHMDEASGPTKFHLQSFHAAGNDRELICRKGKIVIPSSLQDRVVDWYHHYLAHPGINRTEETIGQHLWWEKMRDHITHTVQTCAICQRNKRRHKKYGYLPEKEAEAIPWDRLCVDLVGPYTIRQKGKKDPLIMRCVTMIDPATGWFEIHEYEDKRSISVANIIEQEWFSRYPWPTQITFDRGSEFIGHAFQDMISNDYGIKKKPITVRNPQANAIVERIHQVLGNIIRTFELQENYLDEENPWKGILSAAAFAVRSTYHTTLQKTPGQLVFGRDMIFNVKHTANWEYIKARKQKIISKNNKLENAKRTPHTYTAGDQVLLRKGTENKQEQPNSGPHSIVEVKTNGTVRLRMGAVVDSVHIRRLIPYRTAANTSRGGECNMRRSKKRRRTT